MNIIQQNKEKINGILETFDRMIINGYLLNLCNYRQFLYYLIRNNVELKYLSSGKISKDDLGCFYGKCRGADAPVHSLKKEKTRECILTQIWKTTKKPLPFCI